MSRRIQLNDGNSMSIHDINIIQSGSIYRTYWYDGYTSGINLKTIYDYDMADMDVGDVNLLASFINGVIEYPTDEQWEKLTNNFYYLVGGVNRNTNLVEEEHSSGIAICKDRDEGIIYVIAFSDAIATPYTSRIYYQRTTPTVGIGSGSNADNMLYLLDNTYVNGGVWTESNGNGINFMTSPFNIEYVNIGADDTPIYDIVAEQTCDMVAVNPTASMKDGLIRRCPSIAQLPGSYTSGKVPFWNNHEVEHDAQDDTGDSSEGGGDGIKLESVDIDFPELPPSILLASGIVKMYSPTITQMNNFVNFIYSAPDQLITNFKKLWANPMDSIISLALSPIAITTDGAEEIKFCGVGSNVYANVIKDQYMTLDCGTVQVPPLNNGYFPEEYKTLLDYSSYTKVKCFLPFFGFFDMETDEVTGAIIHIKYNIDLLTGEALAVVKCTKEKVINNDVKIKYNSCLYQFKGNIISQVPLTGNNYQQLYSGVINLVTAVALPNPATVAGVAKDLLGQKVTTQHGGSLTGNGGALGEYTPYLIVTKPIRHKPQGFGAGFGYPSDLGQYTFDQYEGYLEVDTTALRLNDIENITDVEIDMLKNILETGIVINERS